MKKSFQHSKSPLLCGNAMIDAIVEIMTLPHGRIVHSPLGGKIGVEITLPILSRLPGALQINENT